MHLECVNKELERPTFTVNKGAGWVDSDGGLSSIKAVTYALNQLQHSFMLFLSSYFIEEKTLFVKLSIIITGVIAVQIVKKLA